MKLNALILIILTSLSILHAQDERKYIRKGNQLYYSGDLAGAEEEYNKALDKKAGLFQAYFNKGNVYIQQDSFTHAADQYNIAAGLTENKKLKAQAYHNMGNSLLQAGDYENSIEAYKNALRNNPDDQDTRYNLSYALSKLKEQPPDQDKQDKKQDKDKGKDDDKSQQNKNQEKDPNQQDKQGQKNENPEDSKQGKNGNPDDAQKNKDAKGNQEQNVQPKEGQLTKMEAERLLDALQSQEEKVQLKLQRQQQKQSTPTKTDKDW